MKKWGIIMFLFIVLASVSLAEETEKIERIII